MLGPPVLLFRIFVEYLDLLMLMKRCEKWYLWYKDKLSVTKFTSSVIAGRRVLCMCG